MKKKLISLGIIVVFIILILNIPRESGEIKGVKIAGQDIKVDLAISNKEKAQGLSGRAELGEDEGMLFVFDKPSRYSFWMKDMILAIDMIWISEDLKVAYIQKDARPESYPESFGPKEDAKYVLEVISGFAEKNNLKVGDAVVFTYQ